MRTLHIFGDSFAAAKAHLWGRSEDNDKYHSLEESVSYTHLTLPTKA